MIQSLSNLSETHPNGVRMVALQTVWSLVLINCVLWTGVPAPAPVFNIQNCEGGCKSSDSCPANAACIPAIGQCGLCICTVGFTVSNGECVANSGSGLSGDGFGQRVPSKGRPSTDNGGGSSGSSAESQSSGGGGGGDNGGVGGGGVVPASPGPPASQSTSAGGSGQSSTAQTTVQTPSSPGSSDNNEGGNSDSSIGKSNGNNGKGGGGTPIDFSPPEQAGAFDCSKYKCDGQVSKDGKDCSDAPPNTIQCPNLAGGGQCMLGSCLRVNSSLSYCMCPYGRQSRTCHVKKTGSCSNSDGKLPSKAAETKGKRFRHIRDPENGAVLARHAVSSLTDCVRLCQWATYQQCRSINYGTLNGQKTCELLTVWANKESILYQWLKNDSDWTYVCCFQ